MADIESSALFELAPIAMWVEDFSDVKSRLMQWKAEGVDDLAGFLRADLSRVSTCSQSIKVVAVNRKTLDLFGADDLDHLVGNLANVFQGEMLETHIAELCELWEGKTEFTSNAVNYTLQGRRLDILLRAVVLPGHEASWDRVLLTTEDVTAREDARRQEQENRRYAQAMFDHSPVSLWMEDFSSIKRLLDDVRQRGIADFRTFMDVHPDFVQQCMSEIRVVDVNQATLDLFVANDRHELLCRLGEIFRDGMERQFKEQLLDLWNGDLFHQREILNYALDGSERHVLLQFCVFPGYEQDWSLVQVALTDITARKKAEAYLEYLGKHDVLTRLHNRAFYMEELNRLERKPLRPVSAILIDLNGLKEANDTLGHDAGDALLRRMGEVLNGVVAAPDHAARIGGDEFAILMPGTDRSGVVAMAEAIHELLKINNQFYSTNPLSISMGWATSDAGETMEALLKRADLAMYEQKKLHHSLAGARQEVAGSNLPLARTGG